MPDRVPLCAALIAYDGSPGLHHTGEHPTDYGSRRPDKRSATICWLQAGFALGLGDTDPSSVQQNGPATDSKVRLVRSAGGDLPADWAGLRRICANSGPSHARPIRTFGRGEHRTATSASVPERLPAPSFGAQPPSPLRPIYPPRGFGEQLGLRRRRRARRTESDP